MSPSSRLVRVVLDHRVGEQLLGTCGRPRSAPCLRASPVEIDLDVPCPAARRSTPSKPSAPSAFWMALPCGSRTPFLSVMLMRAFMAFPVASLPRRETAMYSPNAAGRTQCASPPIEPSDRPPASRCEAMGRSTVAVRLAGRVRGDEHRAGARAASSFSVRMPRRRATSW